MLLPHGTIYAPTGKSTESTDSTESTEGTESTHNQERESRSVSVSPSDRITELLARHALGEYQRRPAVQARLDAIFAEWPTPAGTLDRLLTACDHLGVTGEHADTLTAEAVRRTLEAQGHTPDGSPTNTPTVEHADAPTRERPNTPRGDTSQYHRASKGRP